MRIANDLGSGILLAGLGWAGVYKGLIVLAMLFRGEVQSTSKIQ